MDASKIAYHAATLKDCAAYFDQAAKMTEKERLEFFGTKGLDLVLTIANDAAKAIEFEIKQDSGRRNVIRSIKRID